MSQSTLLPAIAISSLPEPLVVVSVAGVIVAANPAFAALFGRSAVELAGRSLPEFTITPEADWRVHLERCCRTSSPLPFAVDLRVAGADAVRYRVQGALLERGSSRSATTVWLRFDTHVARGLHELDERIAALNREILARRAAESALQDREARLRFVMESMPQKIFTARPSGDIDYFNQQWMEFTGLSFQQIMDWGWTQFVHPDDVEENVRKWKHSVQTGEPFHCEHRFRRADGVYRWHLSRAVPFRDPAGNVLMWIGSNTDIHDQKQAEAALVKTEKLAAVGRLAATMAHEINNPLESVTNLLYLAARDPGIGPQARRHLALADQELDRVSHIAKQTLGFYRDSSAPAWLDVSQTIDELLNVYSYRFRNRDIALEKDLSDSARVFASAGEFRQVFANLFVNAVDAISQHGGRVRVRVRHTRLDNGSRGAGVRITIADNGCGINPAHRERIFEPFFTTKENIGTGLGLWLSRTIVQKHGGSIRLRTWTHPRPSGTVFSVVWPASHGPEALQVDEGGQCERVH